MALENLEFNGLDFHEIGAWPLQSRIIVLALLGLVVFLLNYFLFINDQVMEYNRQHQKHFALRKEFRDKYHKAANLDAYKNQMEDMKNLLRKLLRQLPSEGKVASLMEDISLQAIAAGLEFDLIKPDTEINKEFYTELPIRLSIIGTYHGFGKFISGIAMLPRIVTLHDFDIKIYTGKSATARKQKEQPLILELNAKTYWCVNRENL